MLTRTPPCRVAVSVTEGRSVGVFLNGELCAAYTLSDVELILPHELLVAAEVARRGRACLASRDCSPRVWRADGVAQPCARSR
jgi:hypothetical protein